VKRIVLLIAVILVVAGGPRVARFLAAYLLALDLLVPGFRPTLHATAASEVLIGSSVGTLYRPERPSSCGLVLVHGLSRLGQAHPFFERMGRALARAGFTVLAPDFPSLRAFHLAQSDVARVVDAVKALEKIAPGPMGILGFSFGAGPALLAAADPAIRDRIALVGSFGGYWDLTGVIVFITTGWYEEDGEWRHARQEEYNRWKLLAALTPYVAKPIEQRELQRLVELKLADPQANIARDRARLGREAKMLLALVENRERERVQALLESLSTKIRAELHRLSPGSRIGEVRARLLIAHGADDNSIPYSESLRLARAAPALGRLVILSGLTHVFPSEGGWGQRLQQAWDVQRLVGLLDDLLAVCRRT
jgi:pimeloyl-ACP methyl ester carboxylesterase